MADVLMMLRAWAMLAALYGIDIILTQPEPGATWAGLMLIAAAALVPRFGTGILSAAALVGLLGPATSTETAFVMWGSAALALFRGAELRLSLRLQVAITYLFAAANKLWPAFLSGGILAGYVPWLPFPALLAPIAVAGEAFLAIAVLRQWRIAIPAMLGFHASIALMIGSDPRHALSLLVYGAMVIWSVVVANGLPALDLRHTKEERKLSASTARPAIDRSRRAAAPRLHDVLMAPIRRRRQAASADYGHVTIAAGIRQQEDGDPAQ